MKKMICLILIFIVFNIFSGCQNNSPVEDKSDSEIAELSVDKKLLDFESIEDYLLNDEVFLASYYDNQGEKFTFKNYEVKHLDFNDDGKLDDALIIYESEDDYNPLVFVTLIDGEYKNFPSNIRASKGSDIYMESGFLVVNNKQYYRLGKVLKEGEFGFIKDTYCGFTIENSEYNYLEGIGFRSKIVSNINKIDGYRDFEIELKEFMYDEKDQEHLISHNIYRNTFNEEIIEHDQTSKNLVEIDYKEVFTSGMAIGSNANLKKFEEIVSESGSLKSAIDYYIDNRKEFDRESRLKYINDFKDHSKYYSEFLYPEFQDVMESGGVKVRFFEGTIVKKEDREIYKIVKSFYVEDGENSDYNFTIEEGDYFITCIDPEYSMKIRVLKFDGSILTGGDGMHVSRDDDYVDAIFTDSETIFKEVEDIVYPTVLLENMNQLNELKGIKFWKTNIVIVPEDIKIFKDLSEDSLIFENEMLYSRDEEFFLEYPNYNLVIIPLQKSINEEKLGSLTIDLGEEGEFVSPYQFLVFGDLKNSNITLRRNPLDENDLPFNLEIGDLSNMKVVINAPMPTDFSHLLIEGKYYDNEGNAECIEFGISSVADDTSYEIITRK